MATRALIICLLSGVIMYSSYQSNWILPVVLFGISTILWGIIAIKEYEKEFKVG